VIELLHIYTSFLYVCEMRSQRKSSSVALFEIAEAQQGYFTAKQAVTAGYLLGSQAHHVKAGNWVRVERGVYRLARFPQSPEEQLVIYSLWTRNRAGEPEGVFSHQTALSIHELSDVNPAKLHMIVPPTFRRSAKVPKLLVLHYASINDKDIEQRQGFGVTRPMRAIADLAASESVSRDIIEQALTEGQQRGLITVREIAEVRHLAQIPKWFDNLLVENKR
jgi:predicted transcriptional regulator of viral defense system